MKKMFPLVGSNMDARASQTKKTFVCFVIGFNKHRLRYSVIFVECMYILLGAVC